MFRAEINISRNKIVAKRKVLYKIITQEFLEKEAKVKLTHKS